MPEAFLVRVTYQYEVLGRRATSLWAVVSDTPEQALETVARDVSAECDVELIDSKLRPETVERLGIRHGEPREL
jgi:hypothetical protein